MKLLKGKNILITGIAGLLGSRLADWIIENTYHSESSTGMITNKVHISRPIDTGDNQDREIGLDPGSAP